MQKDNDGAVEFEAKFGHGVGFIHVLSRKQLRRTASKRLLSGGNDGAVIFQQSRHVEQAENDAVGRNSHEIMQVTTLAFTVISGGHLGGAKLRNRGLDRLLRGHRFSMIEEEAHFDN